MPGFEVGGVVLGALPLIVEAMKVYADGVSTIERYLKYEIPLRNLHIVLSAEYAIYQNTCEELLGGLVIDNNERAELLEHPAGSAWKKPGLANKVEERLLKSYATYVDTMVQMNVAVADIKRLLKLGPDGEVQLDPSSKFRREYHRLRFSLKKEYETLVLRIRQHNATLRTLTHQSLALEKTRTKRSIPDFELVRKHASTVYKMLCAGFKCGCQAIHGVSLKLEGIRNHYSAANLPPFHIVLSYSSNISLEDTTPWSLEALDVRPFQHKPNSTPTQQSHSIPQLTKKKVSFHIIQPSTPKNIAISSRSAGPPAPLQINNLCQTMGQIKQVYTGSCMGFLEDDTTRQKLGLYQPRERSAAQRPPYFVSLSGILSSRTRARYHFSAGHRIRLALLLSSNVLQLYRTPWLVEAWGHDDIAFMEGPNGDILEDPFISKTSVNSGGSNRADSGVSEYDVFVLNRTLFALGVLLIELCLGQPFEELRERGAKGKTTVNMASDFAAANRMLDEVANEFGDLYSDVVRRCIRCAFDTRRTDLGDGQFRLAVYEGVVLPLEEVMKNFKGIFV